MFLILMTMIPLLMAIYVAKRLILPCNLSLGWKLGLTGILLLFSQASGMTFLLFGTTFRTEKIMIISGFCFCLIFMLFICCLLANLTAFLTGLFMPIWSIWFAAFALAVLSLWLATKQPMIYHLKLNAGLENKVKIVQLSDLHIGSAFNGKWLSKVVEKVNALNPDIVVITGDLIDGNPIHLESELQPLKDIKAPIYMVYGNHEYYYGLARWIPVFERLGLHILENKVVLINDIALGGVGMPKADAFGFKSPDLKETFKNIQGEKVRILLSHYPQVFDEAVKNDVFLQLSGHTHGGQLFFPFTLLTKRANKGYVKGMYEKDGKRLYVSSGTGLWGGLPMRLGTLPEIVEITLE